jgi:hypothetical protein
MDNKMARALAWHGDPQLKADTVAAMKHHRLQDEIFRGDYLRLNPDGDKVKGCFHGCLLVDQLAAERGLTLVEFARQAWLGHIGVDWHTETEKHFGIPAMLGDMLDSVFEYQEDVEASAQFAVDVLEFMQPGADLNHVTDHIHAERLTALLERYRVAGGAEPKVRATEYVLELLNLRINGWEVTEEAWNGASAIAGTAQACMAEDIAEIYAGPTTFGDTGYIDQGGAWFAERILHHVATAPVPA